MSLLTQSSLQNFIYCWAILLIGNMNDFCRNVNESGSLKDSGSVGLHNIS